VFAHVSSIATRSCRRRVSSLNTRRVLLKERQDVGEIGRGLYTAIGSRRSREIEAAEHRGERGIGDRLRPCLG
jgi:hypothetical protein